MGHVIWGLSAEYNGDYGPRTIRTTDQRFYGLSGLQTKGFTDYTDYRPKALRTIRTTDQRFHGLWTADYTDYRPKVLRTIRTDYTQFPLSPIREGNLERDGGRPDFVKA